MRRCRSATGLSTSARARTIRWFKPRAAAGRILPRGAGPRRPLRQTELRLVNVARASLDELLLDYEDFLRQRGKRQWRKDDAEARQVRAVGLKRDPTDQSDPTDHRKQYSRWLEQSKIPKWLPTRSFAWFIKPTTCSTSRSPRWSGSLFKMAVTPNCLPPHDWRRGAERRAIRRIGPIGQISLPEFQAARFAAS